MKQVAISFNVCFVQVTDILFIIPYACPVLAVLRVFSLNQGALQTSPGILTRQHFSICQLRQATFVHTVLPVVMLLERVGGGDYWEPLNPQTSAYGNGNWF